MSKSTTRQKFTRPILLSPRNLCNYGNLILNGLIELNLSKKHNIGVRKVSGATVDDLNHRVHPILKKSETHHHSHRTEWYCSFSIYVNLDKLLKLKSIFKKTLPETDVTFSTSTISSENVKAEITVRNLCEHLIDLNTNILDKRKITGKYLGIKRIHLNKTGSTHLAKKLFKSYRDFNGLWNTSINFQRKSLISVKGLFLGYLLSAIN